MRKYEKQATLESAEFVRPRAQRAVILQLARTHSEDIKQLLVASPSSVSMSPSTFKNLIVFEDEEKKIKDMFLEYIDRECKRIS